MSAGVEQWKKAKVWSGAGVVHAGGTAPNWAGSSGATAMSGTNCSRPGDVDRPPAPENDTIKSTHINNRLLFRMVASCFNLIPQFAHSIQLPASLDPLDRQREMVGHF